MRLIDADELKGTFIDQIAYMGSEVEVHLNRAKTIDPESVRPHGLWKDVHNGFLFECSICHAQTNALNFKSNLRYCHNCGARMDEEGDICAEQNN